MDTHTNKLKSLYQAISAISARIIIISQWNEASHEIMGIQNEWKW